MNCTHCNQPMNKAGKASSGTQLFRCINPECSSRGKKTTGNQTGRPRSHQSNAEKQKAYRARKKDNRSVDL